MPENYTEKGSANELKKPDFAAEIARDIGVSEETVGAVVALLDDGCTVPFIARYRKEATRGADDVAIASVAERIEFHRDFFSRKCTIFESIRDQGKLTPELREAIQNAVTRTELEDLYLPYRPKRRTRATIAKEKGLEPLADRMWAQEDTTGTIGDIAASFVDEGKDVASVEDALQGARDIVAERIVETAEWRSEIRELTWKKGNFISRAARGKAEEKSKFTDYYDFCEPVASIPSHRVLAILRGEKEGYISEDILPDPETAKSILLRRVIARGQSIWEDEIREAAADAYDRLLSKQIATDIRAELKEKADVEAIDVFASNLRDLLMAPPFGSRPLMAIDPGYRTGCKVVILNSTGRLLDHGVIYPTIPREDIEGTRKALDKWFERFPDIAAVAVGNGTGGRETFAVIRGYLDKKQRSVKAVLVNESGASVYSASEVARVELPDHDVTVRGAVSIGRRLQDPLAELVKIDPKSIGVGQYQHDVDQKLLKKKLEDVVESCVNQVGVDLNTASAPLLGFVSGLGNRLAKTIVAKRDEDGPFESRDQLLGVPGLGEKTFEQAAGFLRIKGGNPLDDSAVHPERYRLVEQMAADVGCGVVGLVGNAEAVRAIDTSRYVDETVGEYTLNDILAELEKPGRDPREDFEIVEFREDINDIKELTEGLVLNGVVTNITKFGAFVDVGVHQDGLVHVSQIADRFVRDPADELKVGQKVRVKVLDVDLDRSRISLSIKDA